MEGARGEHLKHQASGGRVYVHVSSAVPGSVRLGERVYAVKETQDDIAFREYKLLRDLQRIGMPAVVAQGVVTGRESDDDEELQFDEPVMASPPQAFPPDPVVRVDGAPPRSYPDWLFTVDSNGGQPTPASSSDAGHAPPTATRAPTRSMR